MAKSSTSGFTTRSAAVSFARKDRRDVASNRGGVPYSYTSTAEWLKKIGKHADLKIHEIVFANELTWRNADAIRGGIQKIWGVMCACIARGLETEGILPGGLKVRRRAPGLARRLQAKAAADPLSGMDWLNVFAIAVNEENAAGGRVVTERLRMARPASCRRWRNTI